MPENTNQVTDQKPTWELVGKVRRFNTGRRYAADGQPITYAVFRRDEPYKQVVAFKDHARGIEGCIDLHFGNLDLVDDRWVLRAYDDHHWSGYNCELSNALRTAIEAGMVRGPHSGTSASGSGY